jgi:peptidoglycan-associated lipoprotein
MKTALRFLLYGTLCLALGLTACAKKTVTDTSADMSKAKVSDDDAARQRQLEEERRRQAELEEQQRRAAAMAAVKQEVANMIFFDFDKYDLKPEAREVLQKKAQILKDNSVLKIIIAGNCDERGTEEYNLALGERRARAAYEYLVLLGIEAGRMSIVSYGEERPLDPGHGEAAWSKNRRDEFTIVQ